MVPGATRLSRGLAFWRRLPYKRLAFWGLFGGILFVFRDFFDVIFLTFIFSYIFGNVVAWFERRVGKTGSKSFRKSVVICLYALLLSVLAVGIYFAYPQLLAQGRLFLESIGHVTPAARRPPEAPAPPRTAAPGEPRATAPEGEPELWTTQSIEGLLEQILGKPMFEEFRSSSVYEFTLSAAKNLLNSSLTGISRRLGDALRNVLSGIIHLVLALILSFLVVFDLPRLRAQIAKLEGSRIGNFYREIVPVLRSFGKILGKAFQAQAVIGTLDTSLTLIGLLLLGIPSPFLLAGIVFVCTFIPVVGVLISTIPTAVFALQQGGGPDALYILLWILGVQLIDSFILSPLVVGDFMEMAPLSVLIILVVSEHLFGLWGLLLGVPVTFFLYHHWVTGQDAEIASKPLGPARKQ
jgi:predicted PurR-regulated permease PerM